MKQERVRCTALIFLLGLAATPGRAQEIPTGPRAPWPTMVTLIHHHSFRGIAENAFPILQARGARATLGLVVFELEHTAVPPSVVSRTDLPGGFGNLEPISIGAPDSEGLYPGRKYLEHRERQMTDDEIRGLLAAGWELAFHGMDHTPQSGIASQKDGINKLLRAYQTGVAEIRRLSGNPTYRVRTNTLASNSWSDSVRSLALWFFDWTEIRWRGAPGHIPVNYGLDIDPHGTFQSVDFQRASFDGDADIDALARFADNEARGWLIIQLHDVVERLEDSPHPPTAMLVGEYERLVTCLAERGVEFVTFSEGAERIREQNRLNQLRNTGFGVHPFLNRTGVLPMDWRVSGGSGTASSVSFEEDGVLVLESLAQPAPFYLGQTLDVLPRRLRSLVVRLHVKGEGEGRVEAGLRGPHGAVIHEVAGQDVCFEIPWSRLSRDRAGTGEIEFVIRASDLLGWREVSGLSVTPRPGPEAGCQSEPPPPAS
jgi:peptidoglycan/xylan/chitin deacetylase (PgdA/CDA1 family)